MGLIKLIILVAIVVMALVWWRRFQAWQAARRPPSSAPGAPEPMVRCAHCALHLPRNLALQGPDQRWYCSQEHLNESEHG
ncbi:PP0621 family protein [Pseudomonas sp.]|jgi:uncharacterized protein|uniref:PP0621 family protein n=1 Tax=Pseudomonas sp. TaxID=306 RepID=UPI00272C4123|nr:PP0621 family protein [Pseudomonas sp.]